MKVLISESALKQYKKINKPYSELIKNKIDTLGENGLNNNEVKALTGEFKGYYRLRVGDYRIVFENTDDIINIVAILHRKDVYN